MADPPTGVSATAQPDGVAVSWNAVDGATGYDVLRDGESVGTTDATTWRFITFYTSDRELFTIYAEWEGHSQDELRDSWFADAPF